MILILSEDIDQTTNDVISWIMHYKSDFVRINDTSECCVTDLSLNNDKIDITLAVQNQEIKFSKISSYWYRRGDFKFKLPTTCFNNDLILKDSVVQHLGYDVRVLSSFLHYILRKKFGLGCFFDNYINKLENLLVARESGLHIPETMITSKVNKVVDFIKNNNEVITKAISESIMFSIAGEGAIQSYTNIVHKNDLESYDNIIFPSLFQRNINKKHELRIFYLDGVFYSMAIFSQSNSKTKTDFRNYDQSNMNRCIPYTLPLVIQKKLNEFMRRKAYKTGSIDMLVDNSGDFIFLEVNPIGQFGMVSFPCNYYLEKKVAKYLCKLN